MADPDPDMIDAFAGIAPGSALHALRARRSAARDNAEASYRLLLHPERPGDFPTGERRAVAAFVAALHGDEAIAAHYRALAGDGALADIPLREVVREADRARAAGPYGAYPAGPLAAEDEAGPLYRADAAAVAALGGRLTAALEHAHLLVLHPRDAGPDDLGRLLDAGWTPDAIVTLSQLVAFLSFQIRAAVGLRALRLAGSAA